jgi:hypothetical protein
MEDRVCVTAAAERLRPTCRSIRSQAHLAAAQQIAPRQLTERYASHLNSD